MGKGNQTGHNRLRYALDTSERSINEIYKETKNLRAVQILLGHTNLDSTVRHFSIEVNDALDLTEQLKV